MPSLIIVENDLIKKLQPAAASTRASYSRMRRPWTPGYRALARSDAAAKVAGFNSYHPGDVTHSVEMQGAGATASATPAAYDIPAAAAALLSRTLPTTTPLTDAPDYLNAICLIYAPGDRDNAILLERIATGGANVARSNWWRVEDANTFSIVQTYAAGPLYGDVTFGWTIEIQLPTLTDITTLWEPTAADSTVLKVQDFMAAGNTAETGNVILDRVYR